jgi:WS/DGAT/MGAT family acyltransferase
MRQLTSLDAQFLAIEDARNYGHVSSLALYDPSTAPDGKLTVERMRELLEERIHLLPPFRWKLVEVPFNLDHPYWIEDEDFDVEFHVRELALPEPGDDRQLAEQVARLHSRPLDRAHPLWELYVIQGVSGGRVGVMTKMHHSAVDGMSGAEILAAILDLQPSGRDVPPPAEKDVGEERPGDLEMLGRGLAAMPRQPLRALRALPGTLPNLDETPFRTLPGAGLVSRLSSRITGGGGSRDGGVLERPRKRAPRTPFNGRLSPHRRVAFVSLSLTEVKQVKNAMGTTVNDVVVSMCAGATRRWLEEHDALPDAPLLAMIPVSVRTPEEFGTYGNKVSMMITPIPTDKADAGERLEHAHQALRSAKERHKAIPASLMQDTSEFIPPALVARAARATAALAASSRVEPVLNLVISNVPGSPVPLYCAGARLLATYPVSAISDGAGVNFTVLSYMDRIDFGLVVDREMVPDPWLMIDALRDELAQLVALAGEQAPAEEQSPTVSA